jgi:dihydrofolate synthase/folylpolyglutamate synthase
MWMFSKLPMYQRKGAAAYRPGLDAMKKLDKQIGKPHGSFKSIHIAGTNGKGSTAHMIASIVQTAGYKTGLYTSPHLLDFRERIKVNGLKISKDEVVEFISIYKKYFEDEKLSFFEMTVGLAFWYFKKKQVEYGIIEVGLGGRLDATNIIAPVLSVITNIGLDHTQFLGNTHADIAREKAGIIKSKTPVVIGSRDKKTEKIFLEVAKNLGAPIYFNEDSINEFRTDLKGTYQSKNIQTAILALNCLPQVNFEKKIIQQGLLNVISNTGLMGRWQSVNSSPQVILDVAHNKEGLTMIREQLNFIEYGRLYLVMGFVQGRNVAELLSLFPNDAYYYLSSPNIARALKMNELKKQLKDSSLKITYTKSILKAYENALLSAKPQDLILVLGSTFAVSEVLKQLKN